MKNFSFVAVRWCLAILLLGVCVSAGAVSVEQPLKGEALLVWGTNDPQSPDPKHIPVDADLAAKLSKSPYRWKYYFEVTRQVLEVPVGITKTNLVMSKKCVLDIKNLGANRIEVKLYGDGKHVSTNKEAFVEDWPLIFAGSAGNETAWLVVLRKAKNTTVVSGKPVPK